MEYASWLPVGVALIGGGAAGALINTAVSSYRSRIQPVAYRVSAREMFRREAGQDRTVVKVSVSENGEKHEYDNLHELVIDIFNSGNIDRASFEFGISLRPGCEVIFTELTSRDRHHTFSNTSIVRPGDGRDELDFKVEPFNRKDTYALRLYVISDDGEVGADDIEFSSSAPVKFKLIPKTSVILLGALKATAIFPGGYIGAFTAEILDKDRSRRP